MIRSQKFWAAVCAVIFAGSLIWCIVLLTMKPGDTVTITQDGKTLIFLIGKGKQPMEGSIFAVQNGHLTWVCDISTANAEKVLLMPGDYQIMLSPRQTIAYNQVKVQSFTIKSSELKHLSF